MFGEHVPTDLFTSFYISLYPVKNHSYDIEKSVCEETEEQKSITKQVKDLFVQPIGYHLPPRRAIYVDSYPLKKRGSGRNEKFMSGGKKN